MNALDIAWAILKLDPEKFTPEERREIGRTGGLRRLRGTAGGLAGGKDVPLPTDAAVARLIAGQRAGPEEDIGEGTTPKQTVLPGAGPQGAPKTEYGGFSPVGEKQMMDDPNLEGEFRPPRIPLLEGQEALDAEAALSPDPPESPTQDERYEEMGRGVEELIRPLQRQQRRERLASVSDSEKRDLVERAIRQGMDKLWSEHPAFQGSSDPPSADHRQLFTPEAERAKPIIEDYIQSIKNEMGGAPSSQEIRDQMKNLHSEIMELGYAPDYSDMTGPGDKNILGRLHEEGIHPGGIEHYLHQKHIRPHEVQEEQRARAERKVQVQQRKKKEREAKERFAQEDPQARLRQQFESMIEGSDEEQPPQRTVGVKSQRPPPPTRGQRRVGVRGDSNE